MSNREKIVQNVQHWQKTSLQNNGSIVDEQFDTHFNVYYPLKLISTLKIEDFLDENRYY